MGVQRLDPWKFLHKIRAGQRMLPRFLHVILAGSRYMKSLYENSMRSEYDLSLIDEGIHIF